MFNPYILIGVGFVSGCSLIFSDGELEDVESSFQPSNIADFSYTENTSDCVIPTGATWRLGNESIEVLEEEVEVGTGPSLELINLPGGLSASLLACRDFRIEEEGILESTGDFPIIVLASGRIQVLGTLDVGATLRRPGPGGDMESGTPVAPLLPLDGGGGASYGGFGGKSSSKAILVSELYGTHNLIPLIGGSRGGDNSRENLDGGGGGGGIQLSSRLSIEVTGAILSGGGGGAGAKNNDGHGGSGGGSGGAILLEAPVVTISITGYVGANGGGGGGGGVLNPTSAGRDGGNGGRTLAIGGDSSPDNRRGGDGAYGGTEAKAGNDGTVSGGGGGGFGRIRINTRDKQESDYSLGLSPPMSHQATTLGTLSPL